MPSHESSQVGSAQSAWSLGRQGEPGESDCGTEKLAALVEHGYSMILFAAAAGTEGSLGSTH